MVVDALRHACDALDYLRLLRNQSVFNFAAIPAAMAIATLDLCFMNSDMFERNIKIRKARAADVCAFLLLVPLAHVFDSAPFSSSCARQTRSR
jgi:phytoene/squalene synthetase